MDGHIFSSLVLSYVEGNINKQFQTMKVTCNSEDDYKFNIEKVINVFTEIGLNTMFTVQDIVKPSTREMFLLVMQLFYAMPHYIPKPQPIVFNCILGEEVTKTIELSNKTPKAISYWVKLEPIDSQQDFQLESGDNIKIEP